MQKLEAVLGESVVIVLKCHDKNRFYSSLNAFLRTLADSLDVELWNRRAGSPTTGTPTMYFAHRGAPFLSDGEKQALADAIEDVVSWPRPGTLAAAHLPWAERNTKGWHPGSPEARQAFVDAARERIADALGERFGPLK